MRPPPPLAQTQKPGGNPGAASKYKPDSRGISAWREAAEGRENGARQRLSQRVFQQASRCVLDWDASPAGRHHHLKTRKYATCHGKSRRLLLRRSPGAVSPNAWAFPSFALWSCGSHGYEHHCLSKQEVWGLVSQAQVFTFEVPHIGFKPLASGKSSAFWVSSGWCVALGRWKRFVVDCVSPPTRWHVGFFSFPARVGVRQLVFGCFFFFFQDNCSICSCRFHVSEGGGAFRILLRRHCEQNL